MLLENVSQGVMRTRERIDDAWVGRMDRGRRDGPGGVGMTRRFGRANRGGDWSMAKKKGGKKKGTKKKAAKKKK
jgi:hypothetical protein